MEKNKDANAFVQQLDFYLDCNETMNRFSEWLTDKRRSVLFPTGIPVSFSPSHTLDTTLAGFIDLLKT